MTARRKTNGPFERFAFLAALGVTAALAALGALAALRPTGGFNPPAPYFVFAAFAAFCAALDLKVVLGRGVSGAARLRRHLWRMCGALFFAGELLLHRAAEGDAGLAARFAGPDRPSRSRRWA